MHDIEPYYHWRDKYIASEDELSPYFQKEYDEFTFSNKIYNYFIHPQWDEFGSSTLYAKILFVDYDNRNAIIELIGEWNDCLQNDIMFLKRNLIEVLQQNGIIKFALVCENVLNFHGSDNCYYQEWHEEIADQEGWICLINTHSHVMDEMAKTEINYYVRFGEDYNNINWRRLQPKSFVEQIDRLINSQIGYLH
jgi:hypothetical protein